MNYNKLYNKIIDKALKREYILGYYETHHIIPKCLGGSNKKDNLVKVTAKEHYILHHLLTRQHPSHSGIVYAYWMMCKVKDKTQERFLPSAKTYEELKVLYHEVAIQPRPWFSGINHPLYGKKGQLSKRFGLKHTPETIITLSEKRKLFTASKETNKKISKTLSYGGCYKAKSVTCHTTGRIFSCAKELAEYLGLSYSSVRRWLNLATPVTFKYSYDQ